jgi:peptidoglycan/LPS O-acetylase OafA/YrhL
LRGIAVLLVVIFHAGLPLPGGFTGVDIFFVVSGYVIGGTLLAELEQTGEVDLARFYGRRVRRLLPALALMVTVVALAGVLLGPVGGDHAGGITGILAALSSANVYLIREGAGYFAPNEALNPFLHTWTLAVEEQFYVLFPTLLVIAYALRRRYRRGSHRSIAALIIAMISLVSFLSALHFSAGPVGGLMPRERFAFYGSPTRAWEFGLGALLVIGSRFLARLPAIAGVVAGVVGLSAILVGAISIHGTWGYPGISALVPTCGACAVIAAGTIGARGISGLLATRPLVWLGDLSYSWYLWHWPFIVLAVSLWPTLGVPVSAAAAALSLLPAWASLRWVENPIRTRRLFARPSVLALAAWCVALPILACLGALGLSNVLRSQPALAAWRASQEMHLDHRRGCDLGAPFGSQPRKCSWKVARARGTIVLVGDSYAGQITEAVVRAGNSDGFNVAVATFPACPFFDIRMYGSTPSEAQCRRYYTRGFRSLLETHPNLVVTSFRADHYTEDSGIRLALGDHGRAVSSASAKLSVMERGLETTLKRLNSAGIQVLLVDPVPRHPTTIDSCAALQILTGSCPPSVSRRVEDRELADPIRIDREAVRGARWGHRLNLEDHLCTRTRCSDIIHGEVAYRDANHLSVAATRGLTEVFMGAIGHLSASRLAPR